MKSCIFALLALAVTSTLAFQQPLTTNTAVGTNPVNNVSTRKQVLQNIAGAAMLVTFTPPALARGRATLEQTYRRYAPRVRSGGQFYATDLKTLVANKDWAGIKSALAPPPKREKEDLNKPDAGVAARAKQAGQFSEARVLVAADLLASAFSDSSISGKTKKMHDAIEKLRDVVATMESTAKQGLGEEVSGGLFGFGGKKVPEGELVTKMRQLYVEGGNLWNEYVLAANEDLPGQFDKFEFIN